MSCTARLISISTVALGILASSMIVSTSAQQDVGGASNGCIKLSGDQYDPIFTDKLVVHDNEGTATKTAPEELKRRKL